MNACGLKEFIIFNLCVNMSLLLLLPLEKQIVQGTVSGKTIDTLNW